MLLNALLTRWARTTRGALSTTFFSRSTQTAQAEGKPATRSDSFWQTILRRQADGAPSRSVYAEVDVLPMAKAEFEASLQGLQGEQVELLAGTIRKCRQLDDLWHLRTWLYNEIARQFSQFEAERRLARLQAHFTAAGRRH
ncbi:hypothetical protein [Pelomonas sp. KK5]|uniref:hypothetical protein n=1 Tax=Pelomonas sp. KK5 TaxID=1855730 RepID=UPI00097BD4BD|nr:hypothetical protein [Pelomonas sp. KK5]